MQRRRSREPHVITDGAAQHTDGAAQQDLAVVRVVHRDPLGRLDRLTLGSRASALQATATRRTPCVPSPQAIARPLTVACASDHCAFAGQIEGSQTGPVLSAAHQLSSAGISISVGRSAASALRDASETSWASIPFTAYIRSRGRWQGSRRHGYRFR